MLLEQLISDTKKNLNLNLTPYTEINLKWIMFLKVLLCIEWINDKILLYSTGNYIQYPVINSNGK